MKIFRRMLKTLLVLFLVSLFAALFFRLWIADRYPKETVRVAYTEPLLNYMKEDTPKVFTQKIRAPYDDNKKGNFFADGLYLFPDASHLQVTLRQNDSTLRKAADFYGEPPEELAAEPLRFFLTVCYGADEQGEGTFRSVEASYRQTYKKYMYTYDKLAFDGVDFDSAVWMRVDILYGDRTEPFGSIAVYESQIEFEGSMVDYPMTPLRLKKGDLPK